MKPQPQGWRQGQKNSEWEGGAGSPGARKGQNRPPWMGPPHRDRSHVTESQGQSPAVSRPHCEPSSGGALWTH